jgi:hypothetical protein
MAASDCIHIPLGGDCSVAYQLKKHGIRTASWPFDWCRSSINQLIDCFQDDFQQFCNFEIGLSSSLHPEIDEDGNLLSGGSIIVKNGYGMQLAHELTDATKLEHYRSRITDRIARFKMAISNSAREIHFIHKENGKIKKSYTEHLGKLLLLLPSHCKLTLVVHASSLAILKPATAQFNGNLRIVYYQEFEPDWRAPSIDWKAIFVWPESPELHAP